MEVYSVGNEYFDRSWLVMAEDAKAAEKRVLEVIHETWGMSESEAAKDSFYVRKVFDKGDVVEERDI